MFVVFAPCYPLAKTTLHSSLDIYCLTYKMFVRGQKHLVVGDPGKGVFTALCDITQGRLCVFRNDRWSVLICVEFADRT